ncbi:MAG TPA: RNase adapter RapZ, partial [Candidatus Competibacteraceae bacterium]|nr:RNase adapter RapZ [Candidatus Competibacteraceae bacterium]
MRMTIVSGLSGSGKTIALQTLEDLHYYCVDNLPVALLKPFAQTLLAREHDSLRNVAVGIDARNFLDELAQFPAILQELRASGLSVEILFLQASDDVLLKRYSETRRKHPLSMEGVSLLEAIREERRLLDPLLAHANLVIDTSHTNVHELRDLVRTRLHGTPAGTLSILFESFAFRNGIPADADFVFDARCLPNPHWEPHLRPLTGEDPPVAAFLREQPEVTAMLDDIRGFLERWIPRFETGSRSYLTIAIGCTGGQHRSVFIAAE